MALTGPDLAALVYADYLAVFPDSIDGVRANPTTGVPLHNVSEAFLDGMCAGYVNALLSVVVSDLGSGVLGTPPGSSVPVSFTLPEAEAATATFLLTQGWVGSNAPLAGQTCITNVMVRAAELAQLQMDPQLDMANGSSVVSLATNPGLAAALEAELAITLPLAFQATGKFCEGDIPGGPVNATLTGYLAAYATALATGTASITAAVTYSGTSGDTSTVTGAVNTGRII